MLHAGGTPRARHPSRTCDTRTHTDPQPYQRPTPRARLSDPGLAAAVVSAAAHPTRTRTPVRLAPQPVVPAPVTTQAKTAATVPGLDQEPTRHRRLREWVCEIAELTRPDQVVWCDGSSVEWQRLTRQLVDAGTFVRLTEAAKPHS